MRSWEGRKAVVETPEAQGGLVSRGSAYLQMPSMARSHPADGTWQHAEPGQQDTAWTL